MTPKTNNYVKIYFKNGLETEGTIVSWSNNQGVINAPDGQSYFIVENISESIMMTQVFATKATTQSAPATIGLREHMTELEEQFEGTYELPSTDETRLQKLAELKDLMNKEERKLVGKHLQVNKLATQYAENQYGTPDFLKK